MVEDFLMAENMGSDYPKLRAVEAYPVKIQGRSSICLRDPEGLAEGAVMVPPELFYIIAMFDGRHSIPDISLAYTRQFGTVIPSDRIREIINQLDEALFLEGNRVSKLRQQALDGYRRAPVRRTSSNRLRPRTGNASKRLKPSMRMGSLKRFRGTATADGSAEPPPSTRCFR